ncbi:MAG: (d)CMP kinase [Clostridia bacterium]|nr:(d)CMP kinase [Clostridia bacterium]
MYQIAIDGPSGAGKSSLAKAAAARLGIVYVDTGALYRTVGYYVTTKGIDPKNAEAVSAVLPEIHVELKFENGTQYVYLNGENLGDKIRRPEISMAASAVSAIPAVRAFLLETQKSIARTHSVIMDGRDIGTVILPEADVKIFLFASDEARAKRRTKELAEKGIAADYNDVLREMRERDAQDRNRDVAPAIPAEDAVMFDNSELTVEESIERLLEIVRERVPSAR